MQLEKARLLVAHIFALPEVRAMAESGDKLSSHQTDHGMKHFLEVVEMARKLCAILAKRRPGLLSAWETDVVIPLAALFHDIGRAVDVADHANAGAKWTRDFLATISLPGDDEILPLETRKLIARIVACHRSETVLKLGGFNDPSWAVVVLADKMVGDEERVRPIRQLILGFLTAIGMPWIPLRKNGVHDRVNFAIKKVTAVDNEEELLLSLELDRRVCDGKLIVDTYAGRYTACDYAAKFLGFKFGLQFVPVQSADKTQTYRRNPVSGQWLIQP